MAVAQKVGLAGQVFCGEERTECLEVEVVRRCCQFKEHLTAKQMSDQYALPNLWVPRGPHRPPPLYSAQLNSGECVVQFCRSMEWMELLSSEMQAAAVLLRS